MRKHSPTPEELAAVRVGWRALSESSSPTSYIVEQVVYALGSAQILQSPETAAELEKLRVRVDELEAERHSTNDALAETTEALRAAEARVAELERPTIEARRNEIRDSYNQAAAMAREDGDHEGAAVLGLQLRDREAAWKAEDAEPFACACPPGTRRALPCSHCTCDRCEGCGSCALCGCACATGPVDQEPVPFVLTPKAAAAAARLSALIAPANTGGAS